MTTFVLVHGAWHGGWCWAKVRRELQRAGHEVLAPTLTGLGERSHLLTREVNLSTHIADVENLIRWENLSDIVLCGHSYGGFVICGVADRLADRVAALVYLDAFTPKDGQSLYGLVGAAAAQPQRDLAREAGEGWRIPPLPAERFNVNAADRDLVDRLCTPQPIATFEEPLHLTGGVDRVAIKSYILATGWAFGNARGYYDEAKAAGWRTLEIPCGHDVMLDAPQALADELIATAKAAGVA